MKVKYESGGEYNRGRCRDAWSSSKELCPGTYTYIFPRMRLRLGTSFAQLNNNYSSIVVSVRTCFIKWIQQVVAVDHDCAKVRRTIHIRHKRDHWWWLRRFPRELQLTVPVVICIINEKRCHCGNISVLIVISNVKPYLKRVSRLLDASVGYARDSFGRWPIAQTWNICMYIGGNREERIGQIGLNEEKDRGRSCEPELGTLYYLNNEEERP